VGPSDELGRARRLRLSAYVYRDVVIDNSVTGLGADGQQAADPCIVWDPGGRRWLVYFFATVGGRAETYVCESRDLLHMRFLGRAIPAGPPGSFDDVHAHKAGVVYHDGRFYAFYSGQSGAGPRSIGLAVSDDGVNFTKHPGNPVLTDPEGTNYLDAPSVIRWRDGNFYMYAYNGNGRNIVFMTTPDRFPLGWRPVGTVESRYFGVYSIDAFYDEELDRVLAVANIFYPKPAPPSEPERSGYLALYVGGDPLSLAYCGALLAPPQIDSLCRPVRYFNRNVFAGSIARVGRGRYAVLFNATEDGSTSSERVLRMDLGAGREQALRIANVHTTSSDPERVTVLRLPPGTRAVLRRALVHAVSGRPSELCVWEGEPAPGRDAAISRASAPELELAGEVEVNEECLGVTVRGRPPISVALSLEVVVRPAVDEV